MFFRKRNLDEIHVIIIFFLTAGNNKVNVLRQVILNWLPSFTFQFLYCQACLVRVPVGKNIFQNQLNFFISKYFISGVWYHSEQNLVL